jgi:hypothetical protein
MKTSELTGLQLDYAVALIEGQVKYGAEDFREQRKHTVESGEYVYRYSTSWTQGGPIIEREMVNLDTEGYQWRATVEGSELNFTEGCGPTPLIAAMRCYVQSKLGDDIEIPEELL